jgi:hypothetical protein
MTKTNILYATLALLVLVIMLAAGFSLYRQHAQLSTALPSSAQWSSAIPTSTPQILVGTITLLGSGSLTLAVQQPPNIGSASIMVGSSTAITKNTPKSAAEMAAAFKEFQKEQAASGGKPFTPPGASDIATLSFSGLKVGDSVIVILTPGSTKDSFTAQSIAVVPAQSGGAAGAASVPPPPALPVASSTTTLH